MLDCFVIATRDQLLALPLGPVLPMGGLVNRIRRFLDADGAFTLLGARALDPRDGWTPKFEGYFAATGTAAGGPS